MVQQQDTPGATSDVPKRSSHFFRDIGKKQIIYIVLPLVLINAGIIHTVLNQVAIKAHADVTNQVKDDSASLPAATDVADDQVSEDIIVDTQPVITTYTVKSGDTLSGIADKFNISINTIRWANDLTSKSSKIAIGDELVILPVTGVTYTVKKGDTLSGIALKFDASQDDILSYNDIEKNAITVGAKIIIPGAEPIRAPVKAPTKKPTPTKPTPSKPAETVTKPVAQTSAPEETSSDKEDHEKVKYVNPIPGGILTQGIHDGNAVDFGAPIGTTVKAVAAGTVIIAKDAGNNGGYGKYIVINHTDGSQTLYGHLSKVSVSAGDKVDQGDTIALSGNTGKSTGPHLHLKVINGPRNPFAKYKIGTQF